MTKLKLFILSFIIILFIPVSESFAANYHNPEEAKELSFDVSEEYRDDLMESGIGYETLSFRAKVVEVVAEEVEGGAIYQDLKLVGRSSDYKNKEIFYNGIENKISSKYSYQKGEIVFVSLESQGDEDFVMITDRSRLPSIFWLLALFVITVLVIGRGHGFRALLSLGLTFLIVVGFVVPKILDGAEPIKLVVFSSAAIVVGSMLIVYGWNKKSRVAISGMLVGVIITAVISRIFTEFASLTGSTVEEVMFIKDLVGNNVDFEGLLLASFILGSLGVLDDIAITQAATTEEIVLANSKLSRGEIFKKVMRVGVDHIASMINTLFLAYAGASFVLLLLFGLNQPPFQGFVDVVNNEVVATEIIRTLVGSVGLILTVPITTYLAAYYYSDRTNG